MISPPEHVSTGGRHRRIIPPEDPPVENPLVEDPPLEDPPRPSRPFTAVETRTRFIVDKRELTVYRGRLTVEKQELTVYRRRFLRLFFFSGPFRFLRLFVHRRIVPPEIKNIC